MIGWMMDKQVFRLVNDQVKKNAIQCIMTAPEGYFCQIKEPTRSLDQNAKLWPMLQDISRQVCWHGNWLSKEEWKDFFTASLEQQKIVPNMDSSGFIALGKSTSSMGKRKFGDLIELIYAFGAERDVEWSEPVEVVE